MGMQMKSDSPGAAAHREAVEAMLRRGVRVPLKCGSQIELSGNGSGYWVTNFYGSDGQLLGVSQGAVFPGVAARECFDLYAPRIAFEEICQEV